MSIIEKKFLPIFTGLIIVCGLMLATYFSGWSGPLYANSNLAAAFASTTCTGKNILFVSATRPLPARDQPLVDHLIALGHAVVVRTDTEVLASDATGKDLVIISESVLSTNVNTKLRAVAVPLITWEGWLFDDLRMTGPLADTNYGELLTATQIRIVNPTHPLAAGLTGDVQVISINDQVNNKFHWGVPNQFATVIATTLGNARHAHIFAYEKGAPMFGMLAPARRVGIQNATGPYLNAAGWAIFDAAVDWAMGGCTGVPPTPTATLAVTPTNTPAPPPTGSPTPTMTSTAMATNPAPSPTGSPTPTSKPTKTATPLPGSTPTATTTHTPTPTATSSSAHLTVTLADFLFNDADGNNLVSSGDKLLYVIKIVNDGASAAQQIHLEDTLDADTALVAGATTTDQGTIIKGNGANDTQVSVDIGALAPGAQANISLQVRINQQLHDTQVQNQAIATFANVNDPPSGQVVVLSDDPDTPDRTDATITPLNGNQPQPNYKFFIPLVSRKNE